MFRGSQQSQHETQWRSTFLFDQGPRAIQYSDCIYNPDPKQKGCERPARRRRFLQRFVSLDNGRVTMQRRFVGELPITSQNWQSRGEGKLTFFFSPGAVLLCHKVSRYSLASSGWTLSDRSGPGHFNVNISHSWQPRPRFELTFSRSFFFLSQIKIRGSLSLFIRERPMAEIDKFKWTRSRYRENKSGSGSTRVGVVYWHILPLGISDPNIIRDRSRGRK